MKILSVVILFFSLFSAYSQKEPTRAEALAVLKKYKYDLYVSKKTGAAISQLKFEKHNSLYGGAEAMYKYKTRVAKQYYWPEDRLVYTYKIVSPKDKDGVQTKYHFEVKYARSKCLTDGYGCFLMKTWELESANKYGPFFIGAKSVDNNQIIELIKDRCKNEKETVLKELTNIDVENWIEIESITAAGDKYELYKEEVISKTKRKNHYLFNVIRANFDSYDPKILSLIPTEYKAEVTYELINGTWQITKMFARSGGDYKDEINDVKKMFLTYETGNFDNVYEKRTSVDFPSESCSAFSVTASHFYGLLKKKDYTNPAFKEAYISEEAYQQDLRFFKYMEANGFSLRIDSTGFHCKSFDSNPSFKLELEVKHDKFKGKLMKDWLAKSKSLSSGASRARKMSTYDYFKTNMWLEMELIKGRWKIKPISNEVLPDI